MYIAWARILGREYVALKRAVAAGRQTVLDSYATTSPAEFFAVATECFFETPVLLKKKHPELYEELKLLLSAGSGRSEVGEDVASIVSEDKSLPVTVVISTEGEKSFKHVRFLSRFASSK